MYERHLNELVSLGERSLGGDEGGLSERSRCLLGWHGKMRAAAAWFCEQRYSGKLVSL